MTFLEKIEASTDFIRKQLSSMPTIGLVLGSGLGALASQIQDKLSIPFHEIPFFPVSTVKGHLGQLVIGKLAGKQVMALQGRVHYYEGYNMQEVSFPIRVMQSLGIEKLILTNACGGLQKGLTPGVLFLIEDHINLMGDSPLRGTNFESLGPRFPDLSQAYDRDLRKIAQQVAEQMDISLFSGVYAAVSGPCYETRAEMEFLKIIGADVVGMSTVPEAIVAAHAGIKTLGIACVTDVPFLDHSEILSHEAVVEVAEKARPYFSQLLLGILKQI